MVGGPWDSEKHVFVTSNSFLGRRIRSSESVTPVKVVAGVYGNFGNQILEAVCACYVASHLGVQTVVVRDSGVFRVGVHQIGQVKLVAPEEKIPTAILSDAIRTISFLRSPEKHLAGAFMLNWIDSQYELEAKQLATITRDMPAGLSFELSGEPLDPKELTVSFRGGDAFSQRPNPTYGQPPLAYYQFVVESRDWTHVRVVSDDWQNPTLRPFLDWLDRRKTSFEYLEQDWKSDVSLLYRSRSVVAPRGSFVPAIYAISPFVEEMFHFGPVGYPISLTRVRTVQDIEMEYSKAMIARDWTKSNEQLSLMVSFPKEGLRFVSSSHA